MREVKTHKFFLLLIFLIPAFSLSFGQPELMFNHLTIDDGLTTNNVRVFLQDYQGFMWIGTENGLHRYDGYDFRVYRSNEDDTTSIGGNRVISLFEDSEKRLWVGTLDGGLALYDREGDFFFNFTHDPKDTASILGNSISKIIEIPEGELWFGTYQGGLCFINLKTFDPGKPVFFNVRLPKKHLDANSPVITSLLPKNDSCLLISLQGGGLEMFNRKDQSFTSLLSEFEYDLSDFDSRLTGIYEDSRGRYWLSSWGGGLYLMFPDQKKMLHYKNDVNDPHSLSNNLVISMIEDPEGNFWVGTDRGLCLMEDFHDKYPKGKFTVYLNDPFNEYSLKTNAIKPLYIDRQGRFWVGTHFGGINIFDPDYLRFKTIKYHPLRNSLPGNNITAIEEDEDGNLWIGTDDNGLCRLIGGASNLDNYTCEIINLKNSITKRTEQKIKTLKIDHHGMIWVGTWGGGLFRYNPEKNTYKHYTYGRPGELPSESVLAIAVDYDSSLWLGTFNGGLAHFNTKTDEYIYYHSVLGDSTSLGNDNINALLVDDKNRLWVGTSAGGLSLYNRESNDFKRINIDKLTLETNVFSLYQCSDGFIWVGTAVGLFRLDPEKGTIQQYADTFGISGNLIQSIIEDKDHYLWIGTEHGLSKFVFSQNSVTNFSKEEGLQSGQFNPNCVHGFGDGMLIFGGTNGMNAFYPNDIKKSSRIPELVFTNFWLNNLEMTNKVPGSPLKENIITAERIDLTHRQNSFSVEYAALEFDFSKRSKYLTYLENFDDDWQNRGTDRKVTYTNLNPGEYMLHVKVINKDGFVSERDKTLVITIHPAWYQTKIFQILIFVLIGGATYWVIQSRINFFKKQSKRLEKKVALRTKELNEKANEILAQNEELQAQNDQIIEQREELESTRDQLTKINSNLEELVKKRTRKLEKTVAELDRFVYSASHDLSAPLKSVLGLLNIAKIDKDPARMGDYLKYMEDSIHRLEDVIKSLITYSRNSRMAIKLEDVHLHGLIVEIIDELAFLPGSEKVRFNYNISEDCNLFTDRQRLKIVLHNLISNSIKYADYTKPESVVDIEYDYQNNKHLILVRDNGIGIEEEMIAKVFSMFFRATERSSGSGLGLFIVKETLGVLKGKIKVTSVEGSETTFAIILPSNQE